MGLPRDLQKKTLPAEPEGLSPDFLDFWIRIVKIMSQSWPRVTYKFTKTENNSIQTTPLSSEIRKFRLFVIVNRHGVAIRLEKYH